MVRVVDHWERCPGKPALVWAGNLSFTNLHTSLTSSNILYFWHCPDCSVCLGAVSCLHIISGRYPLFMFQSSLVILNETDIFSNGDYFHKFSRWWHICSSQIQYGNLLISLRRSLTDGSQKRKWGIMYIFFFFSNECNAGVYSCEQRTSEIFCW